jgi:dihydropyrimidinase
MGGALVDFDVVVRNGRLVFPDEGVREGTVGIRQGRIAAIVQPDVAVRGAHEIDCEGRFVLPGVIDPHVHFGFGSPETDFFTEPRSAALGGVTTAISFYRTADFLTAFDGERAKAQQQSVIDFGYHFGITSKRHVETMADCYERFGISSWKLYLMYKGAAGLAKGFTDIDDGLLYYALEQVAKLPGAVLSVHCENTEVIPLLRDRLREAGRDDLAAWDEQSPDFLEAENVHRVCYFARKTGCPVNIVHLSSREALEEAKRHRTYGGPPIYVETCPQYLHFTKHSRAGSLAKVNPAPRSDADVEALWQGIRDGSINTVGTDHVARKRSTKEGGIWKATAGFPGLATMLPVLMHEGYHRRSVPIERIAAVTSRNAAKLYHLNDKGRLAVGADADLVVVDADLERAVDASTLLSFSDYSPYEDERLKGWPTLTMRRGEVIARDGKLVDDAPDKAGGRYQVRAPIRRDEHGKPHAGGTASDFARLASEATA